MLRPRSQGNNGHRGFLAMETIMREVFKMKYCPQNPVPKEIITGEFALPPHQSIYQHFRIPHVVRNRVMFILCIIFPIFYICQHRCFSRFANRKL